MSNISVSGGTSPTVAVYGKNLGITAGLGTDTVGSASSGTTVAVGNITSLTVSDKVAQSALGNDTINLGSGLDTIVQNGQATVTSAFTNAFMGNGSVAGGELGATLADTRTDVSGTLGATRVTLADTLGNTHTSVATVIGGALDTSHVTLANARTDVSGVSNATLQTTGATAQNTRAEVAGVFTGLKSDIHAQVGSAGLDSMIGGSTGGHVFQFLGTDASQQAIGNFVSPDQLHVDGYSLSYLQAHHDISTQGGNTYISIDGGKTSIELKGINGLSSSEIAHKS